jgi:HlyD family secretion protein
MRGTGLAVSRPGGAMDFVRPPSVARKKRTRRALLAAGVVVTAVLVTLGLSRLKPAAPSVERATLLIDTVKRGEMLRQVHGSGTLVAEEIRWIPAATEGRVERIIGHPGDRVSEDTVILELSNPELVRVVVDAEWQVKAAEADLVRQRVQLQSDLLSEKAAAAGVRADFHQAELEAELQDKLATDGLTSALDVKRAKLRAEEQGTRHDLEEQRLAIAAQANDAQMAVQQARLEQLRALHHLRKSQLDALSVRAGVVGVLQVVPVEVGQTVTPGTNLARVAEPGRLKAEVRIAETQVPEVAIGQTASIDTRNGIVPGRVTRIAPSSLNGSVTVDIALLGELPRGARPDVNVDGTIELERLANILFVGRPAFGQGGSQVGLFRLLVGGKEAVRVPVKLGRSSVNSVEVLEGLAEGDQVVLSDMSQWDAVDRVRLN